MNIEYPVIPFGGSQRSLLDVTAAVIRVEVGLRPINGTPDQDRKFVYPCDEILPTTVSDNAVQSFIFRSPRMLTSGYFEIEWMTDFGVCLDKLVFCVGTVDNPLLALDMQDQ